MGALDAIPRQRSTEDNQTSTFKEKIKHASFIQFFERMRAHGRHLGDGAPLKVGLGLRGAAGSARSSPAAGSAAAAGLIPPRGHRPRQEDAIMYNMRGSKDPPLPGQGPQCDSRARHVKRSWQQKITLSRTAFWSEQNYDDHCTVVGASSVRS